MISKIILAIGILGVLLGLAIALISAALVPLTDGRTSWNEAMLGIIPGIVILVISFLIALIGVIMVIMGRKKSQN
ncbi:MAG: hypothetical protein IPO41_04100 [Acidobacteria bacterium]|jgi:hypothetical protein|nr:hypothetical protein [Acidobacteriota bacterium]MBP7474774.1 hypothetical protein [Pyrinomonadaceae bacterium]MBP9108881.1 hypothetical protein [Pyrinomonadaceae bacterium]